MYYSPPGSSVHGILQPRILEWVAMAPYHLPHPGMEPGSLALWADSLLPEGDLLTEQVEEVCSLS